MIPDQNGRDLALGRLSRREFILLISMLMASAALAIDMMLPAFPELRAEFGLPADSNQVDRAVRFMAREPGCFFLGTGRSKLPMVLKEDGTPAFGDGYEIAYGKADLLRNPDGAKAAIVAMGQITVEAVKAADDLKAAGIPAQVWCVSSPLEIDREALKTAAATGAVVTVEDHHVRTGLGAQVAGALAEEGLGVPFRRLGITGFACSGDVPGLYTQMGIDAVGVKKAVEGLVG